MGCVWSGENGCQQDHYVPKQSFMSMIHTCEADSFIQYDSHVYGLLDLILAWSYAPLGRFSWS